MTESIDIDNIKLCYDRTGSGLRPVIVMHGWGCSSQTIASVAAACADASTTVYNIDLPGFGASPEPPSPWTVYDYANVIQKFVISKQLLDPVIIGHSFGGRIAIILASRMKLDRLVLVDAAGIKPRRKLSYYLKVYSFKAVRHLLPLLLGRERGAHVIERMRGRSGSQDYRNSSPMMRRVMSLAVNEDLRHLLPHITAPVLLIWGANDTATPLADARLMEKLIPDAGLVCYPDAGHFSYLDRPSQTAAVLASFLKLKQL